MRSDVVRLFQTLPHTCGYFAERMAQNLVIDPSSPQLEQLYEVALSRGYRRAGDHVYIPRCQACRACVACRIPVADFRPDRSQRRCLRRNKDLDVEVVAARYGEERYQLYRNYLRWRHPDGGMDDAKPEDFSRFLYTHWSPTRFIEFREHGHLLGVAVTDFCETGLSAVYTFYDPPSVSAASAPCHPPADRDCTRARPRSCLSRLLDQGPPENGLQDALCANRSVAQRRVGGGQGRCGLTECPALAQGRSLACNARRHVAGSRRTCCRYAIPPAAAQWVVPDWKSR
jgi:arginine-tRNA-protein transferase